MRSSCIRITSGPHKINVQADNKVLDDICNSPFLGKYIPSVGVDRQPSSDSMPLPTLIVRRSDHTSFVFNQRASVLNIAKSNDDVSAEDIITIIDYCLDFVRQDQGFYVVHGSASSVDGVGVVFFGSVSGVGKTTINAYLCSECNFNFIADEKVLVNAMGYICGGVSSIAFNKEGLENSIGKSVQSIKAGESQESQRVSTKIGMIIQPIVGSGGVQVYKWSTARANWHLYEELTRKIRGTSRRIGNFRFPIQSIDNNEIALKRVASVESISQGIPFVSLKGSVNDMAGYINKALVDG